MSIDETGARQAIGKAFAEILDARFRRPTGTRICVIRPRWLWLGRRCHQQQTALLDAIAVLAARVGVRVDPEMVDPSFATELRRWSTIAGAWREVPPGWSMARLRRDLHVGGYYLLFMGDNVEMSSVTSAMNGTVAERLDKLSALTGVLAVVAAEPDDIEWWFASGALC